MPFKSDKQRKWMHANEPEMAKKWEKEEKNEEKLIEAYKTATRNELAMYISQLSNTINGTKDKKMLQYLKKTKKEVEKELKSRKTNEGKITEDENPCWKGYKQIGMKEKDGKQVPNCVPIDETVEEATKRDYKAEYKKYGSSKKA